MGLTSCWAFSRHILKQSNQKVPTAKKTGTDLLLKTRRKGQKKLVMSEGVGAPIPGPVYNELVKTNSSRAVDVRRDSNIKSAIIEEEETVESQPPELVQKTSPVKMSSSCGGCGGSSHNSESINRRPIYPNFPFSPFTSPGTSPFLARRRQFKESQRVSVERIGDDVQLNQYRLKEPIGQGSYGIVKLAYNEEDDQHYVRSFLSPDSLNVSSSMDFNSYLFILQLGHEDTLQKKTAAKSRDLWTSST